MLVDGGRALQRGLMTFKNLESLRTCLPAALSTTEVMVSVHKQVRKIKDGLN